MLINYRLEKAGIRPQEKTWINFRRLWLFDRKSFWLSWNKRWNCRTLKEVVKAWPSRLSADMNHSKLFIIDAAGSTVSFVDWAKVAIHFGAWYKPVNIGKEAVWSSVSHQRSLIFGDFLLEFLVVQTWWNVIYRALYTHPVHSWCCRTNHSEATWPAPIQRLRT